MVEVRLLNENFELAGILDTFESFIWTERFNECGDFEYYAHATPDLINMVHTGMHIEIPDSEYTMIVESVTLEHDYEEGAHITLKGRSLESILNRRIIWEPIVYKNITLGSLIKTILYTSFINPSASERRVDNFIFFEPIDSRIENVVFDAIQLFGDNVYDVITQICQTYKVGYKILWKKGSEIIDEGISTSQTIIPNNYYYVFYLYLGEDRSYRQEINPYIVFSPNYDNILNSNYITSIENYKTNCLVLGEGEGEEQTRIEVKLEDNFTGLDRREFCTDASSISTTNGDDDTPISVEEYIKQMVLFGNNSLTAANNITSYDGQIDPTQLYTYGRYKDYYLGDEVQMVNDYGMDSVTRIVEYIRSYSTSGIETYPTFATDLEAEETSYSPVHTGTGGGGGGGGSFSGVHNDLSGRFVSDTHGIDNISSLRSELDVRPDTSLSITDINNICI